MCDHRIPTKLNGKFYKTTIKPTMLYDTEYWAIKKQYVNKMSIAEIKMIRWISRNIRKDRIHNEEIHLKIVVAHLLMKR